MPLPLEGPRPLSPLEREAVDLVFEDSIDPCDVFVSAFYDSSRERAYYGRGGKITLNRSQFWDVNLHMKSSHANTEILKPANIRYLSALIHECTHHWQSVYKKYTERGPYDPPPYDFSWEELQTLTFRKEQHDVVLPESEKPLPEPHDVRKEQYASAAQVYFVIAWQLKHLPEDSDVSLTYEGLNRVGPVDRYHEIRKLDDDNDGKLIVSRNVAECLTYHFNVYLNNLRSEGR